MFHTASQGKAQTMTALHDETLGGLAHLKGIGHLDTLLLVERTRQGIGGVVEVRQMVGGLRAEG